MEASDVYGTTHFESDVRCDLTTAREAAGRDAATQSLGEAVSSAHTDKEIKKLGVEGVDDLLV